MEVGKEGDDLEARMNKKGAIINLVKRSSIRLFSLPRSDTNHHSSHLTGEDGGQHARLSFPLCFTLTRAFGTWWLTVAMVSLC